MDILIKNMEMPSERIMLEVFPDGKVFEIHPTNNARMPTEAEAIEVPPHGDLIDRSLALGACHEMARSLDMEGAFEVIENAPTVIEASK